MERALTSILVAPLLHAFLQTTNGVDFEYRAPSDSERSLLNTGILMVLSGCIKKSQQTAQNNNLELALGVTLYI